MEILLKAEELAKVYGRRKVVDGVSFELASGRVLAMIGPNGAGKTTTVRMILSLTRPSSGVVTVMGDKYERLREPGRAVGALLENAGLHPGRTGFQHARIVARRLGGRDSDVRSLLDHVGLATAADRRIRSYSLGMRQRLGLACALLGRPRVLLLDEPVNGLDPAGIQWVRQYVRRFAEEGGAVLVTSHLLGELEQVADDVVLINDGRVRLAKTMASVLEQGSLEQAYMSVTNGDRHGGERDVL